MAIPNLADRRSSKRSSPDLMPGVLFDAREQGYAGLWGYQSRSRSSSYLCSVPFQPEDTISIVVLLVRSRRFEARPAPETLNSASFGPPDLASVLSSILPKVCGDGREAMINRQLNHALAELERLQAVRKQTPV